jgi:hypothetical protein
MQLCLLAVLIAATVMLLHVVTLGDTGMFVFGASNVCMPGV